MNAIVETESPVYLVDSRANLIIETAGQRLTFAPAQALELIKFIEQTGYQARANTLTKGALNDYPA